MCFATQLFILRHPGHRILRPQIHFGTHFCVTSAVIDSTFYLLASFPYFGHNLFSIAPHPETYFHTHCDPDFLKKNKL